ncbi:MAG: MFS transporter, partial [Gammaproteobacteria bacterium]|nr:MFS transporter [Gammaproteobacteria bacterium]
QLSSVMTDPQLLRLDAGIFILHVILTATFVVLPLALRDYSGLDAMHHWQVYLPALILSVAGMIPFIILAEKHRRMKQVFVGAIVVLAFSEIGLRLFYESLTGLFITIFVFFLAFNLLEATLPSLVSKIAPPDKKGSAMGMYSSSQFFGAFVGGVTGGWLYGQYGVEGVFSFSASIAALWVVIASSMRSPRYLITRLINIGNVSEEEAKRLTLQMTKVTGVAEVTIILEEGVAYLKVDKHALDEEALNKFSSLNSLND